MSSTVTYAMKLWQSCASPTAGWLLVGLPFALLALGAGQDVAGAMTRLLAVLLVAGLLWARGLGPAGLWADRVFTALWLLGWAGALGSITTARGWPESPSGSLSFVVALFVGAGWLSWAVHQRLEAPRDAEFDTDAPAMPAPPVAVVATWTLAVLAFALLYREGLVGWADSVVVGSALALFTAFQRFEAPTAEEAG